mgnify:CR=1 FL=1
MSQRTAPPFRADHVGSLLRPPELLAAREAFAQGRLTEIELRAAEDEAIRDLDGRLFPFGWLKLWWYMRRIDVVSFKLMGVLEEYRRRGIDALLYLELIKSVFAKGYKWLDGSLTSEFNLMVNFLASRLGAERYKHYRIYQIET